MQEKEQEKIKGKKSYEKPRLRSIELVAEEVLGIGCKTVAGDPTGASGGGCTNPACSMSTGS